MSSALGAGGGGWEIGEQDDGNYGKKAKEGKKGHFGRAGKESGGGRGGGGGGGGGYSRGGGGGGSDRYSSQSSSTSQSSTQSYSRSSPSPPPSTSRFHSRSDPTASTRVFVKNLPSSYIWTDLKDLFRSLPPPVSDNVVFASVSIDQRTGVSKCCGIVQFETPEIARSAIKMGMDGLVVATEEGGEEVQLYVREDVQDRTAGKAEVRKDRNRAVGDEKIRSTSPSSSYSCADEDHGLDGETVAVVEGLIYARIEARRRMNFDAADGLRKDLLDDHGVRIDDRAKVWYLADSGVTTGGSGENSASERAEWRRAKGFGMEFEGMLDEENLLDLLNKRDKARSRRDFGLADRLLKEVYGCVQTGEWRVVVDDSKKTWKLWEDVHREKEEGEREERKEEKYGKFERGGEKAKEPVSFGRSPPSFGSAPVFSAREKCLALVREKTPGSGKEEEMVAILDKFVGKEEEVLRKLEERFGV